MLPRVSIITINLNNSAGLKKTIDSVLSQTYRPIEFIVIDGKSTDGSIEHIKAIAEHLSYWISERDTGLYNAMNKGLKVATGDYVLFLNSGDYLVDKSAIDKLIKNASGEDVIYGNLCIAHKGRIRALKSASSIYYHQKYQHNLPPHPVVLFKQNLISQIGFDERYKIIADVVLISKLFSNKNLTYRFVDVPVTVFEENGVSSEPQNQEIVYKERKTFIQEEFPQYLSDFEKVYKKAGFLESIKEKIKIYIK